MPALKVVETRPRSRRSPIVSRMHARAHRALTSDSDYPDTTPCEPQDEAVPVVIRLAESGLASKLTQLAALADSKDTADELLRLSRTISDAQLLVERWDELEKVS